MNKYATIFTSHLFRLGMLKERSDIIDYILTLGGWESPEEVKVITLTGLEEQRKELDAIPTRSGFEDKQYRNLAAVYDWMLLHKVDVIIVDDQTEVD